MSFFSQKKKTASQLRALSENEIQKKLYGNLRPELLDRPRSGRPAVSSQQSSLSFSNPQPVTVAKETSETAAVLPSRDLFDTPASEASGAVLQPDSSIAAKKEKVSEKARMDRLAQLAEIEKPSKKTPLRDDPWKKKSALPALDLNGAGRTAADLGAKTAGALGAAGKGALGAFVVAIAFILRLLRSFDLRKPVVRRVIYWTAGAAALFSIFMGIHLLNVRREEAMKAPPKMVSKAAKKETPVKKTPAAEVKKAAPSTAVRQSDEALTPATPETPASAEKPAVQPKAQTPAADSSAAAPAAGTGRYVIQVATFAGPNDAERVQKSLKAAQLPVFVKALTRPSGRVYYSVFMGRYATFDDAQDGFEIFRKNEAGKAFEDAFIRTID